MKHSSTPLVWLCAAGAAALGTLAIADPGRVYESYKADLPGSTPSIAAVFTAARDGVFPWTQADTEQALPSYRPLTGTITRAEMQTSVGTAEPFREDAPAASAQPGAAAQSVPANGGTPAGDGNQADAGSSTEDKPAEVKSPEGEEKSGFVTVDESWFNDALFIGDSHTEGFADYAGVKGATFYFKRGLDIWSVMKKSFVDGKKTIPQALSERKFGKIYILLGINEIGTGTTESFAAQYASVVQQLRELQPDALIYIQSIFHTSQKKSSAGVYNNTAINARNEAISKIADGEHVFYINCNTVFDDESGALTSAYTGDGVHVKAPYYKLWRDYLLQFGRTGDSLPASPVPAETPAAPATVSASASIRDTAEETPDAGAASDLPASDETLPAAAAQPDAPAEPVSDAAKPAPAKPAQAAPRPAESVPDAGQPVPKQEQPAAETAEPAPEVEPAQIAAEPEQPAESAAPAEPEALPESPAGQDAAPASDEAPAEAPAEEPHVELTKPATSPLRPISSGELV